MFNYKIERVLFVILWITFIYIFSVIAPPQTISLLVQYQYALSSLIITLLIYCIYKNIINHIYSKKINDLILKNDIKLALDYVSKFIKKQPRIYWLKAKKLELLLLIGDICGYQASRAVFSCRKKTILNYVGMLDNMIAFLRQEKIDESVLTNNINKCQSLLAKTNYLLCNKNKLPNDNLILLASETYNTCVKFYRCISSVILSVCYKKAGDVDNKMMYAEKAIANSPSSEVKHYVEFILSKS